MERTIKHAPVNSVCLEILREPSSLIMISASSIQYHWTVEPKASSPLCFLQAQTSGCLLSWPMLSSGKERGKRLCTGDIWSIFPQLSMVRGLWGAPVLPRICVWTGSFNRRVHTLACACSLPHKHTNTQINLVTSSFKPFLSLSRPVFVWPVMPFALQFPHYSFKAKIWKNYRITEFYCIGMMALAVREKKCIISYETFRCQGPVKTGEL